MSFPSMAPREGDQSEYQVATIPQASDRGWAPYADPDLINYDIASPLCDPRAICATSGDFTYFRTIVCLPDARHVPSLQVQIAAVDDGARVMVFNSAFPNGVVVANGYSFLFGGMSTTGDFSSQLRIGEPNTILITHVDDCWTRSVLRNAVMLANGSEMHASPPVELCNGLDDNCDGVIDEGCADASTPLDASADGCAGWQCNPDLRLEGRAGPLGDCACGVIGRARSAKSPSLPALLIIGAAAWARRSRTRRRARTR